ncbi:MAG: N-acetylgalactosamine-4-sulfatase [Acidobacteria bacterium]|nr:N-acetylgalactosamine-4-sulfatase [Acidobacteriota bacterium]
MLRRHFLATALAAQQPPRRKPNIVILFADDLGYGELGFQGNIEFPTPHLDSIANRGVRFTQGYVSAPFCCPSRAGLMTGRYQTRYGHELNVIGKRNLDPTIGLPLTERTVANHLKDAGYRTSLVGKWHLGGVDKFHPQSRGFDEFYGFLHEGHFYYPPPYRGALTRLRTNEPPYDDDNPILRGKDPVEEKAYLTDALAREATSFIDRNREQPFFLYLAFNAIHSPMQAPVSMLGEFENLKGEQRRLFAAMTRSMDNATGQVLNALKRHNLEQDTLVFFLSDNGGPTAELTSSNKPLRGGKGQLYEGGIRVPFAMQWAGKVAPAVNHQPASSLDILPTALAAAGLSAPKNLDGINLLDSQAQAKRDTMFWRYGPNLALRKGSHKIVLQRPADYQVFDLDKDPGESTDLSASQPALKSSLLAELNTVNRQMAPPLWT